MLYRYTEMCLYVDQVNVIGLCMVSQHAVSSMVKGGGDNCIVVNISSVLGFQKPIYHMPYRSAYIASKHAVNGVTASLRGELELAGLAHKIRVMVSKLMLPNG